MKYDVTVEDEAGALVAEFVVSKDAVDRLVVFLRDQVRQGEGKQIMKDASG